MPLFHTPARCAQVEGRRPGEHQGAARAPGGHDGLGHEARVRARPPRPLLCIAATELCLPPLPAPRSLQKWLGQRLAILKQLVKDKEPKDEL
jgi:hypothetical protein